MTFQEYVGLRTIDQLQDELQDLNLAINTFEVFSVRDLRLRDAIERELDERIRKTYSLD